MRVEWLQKSLCYAVKCVLLLQLISRTTRAGCSVDHGSGMNYPTTTASGTWTSRGGISSYGWDSRQPIDPCSRCTNVPPPLPGSQYTTQIHEHGYNANDRIGISGHLSDHRGSGYGSDNPGNGYSSVNRGNNYGSNNRGNGYNFDNRGNNNYQMNNQPNDYNSNGHVNNGYPVGINYGGNSHATDNNVGNGYGGFKANNQIRNPDYRGNGYDNLSPEWERRHNNNKKGSGGFVGGGGGIVMSSGGGYYQGTSYPVPNVPEGQGAHVQGIHHKPSNDRWGTKGAYPVKIDSGYWQSQPPKDIGWDEDSKKVGVIAGWIGGPKKYDSGKPVQAYGIAHDKDDDYFNKGTAFDNTDRKKPYMGWGGSGSYEVIKINNGYKYIDRNSNGDYGTTYGNNYGYGGQSYNNKPSHDYGSIPLNSVDQGRPHNHNGPQLIYDKLPVHGSYDKPSMHGGYDKTPMHGGYDKYPTNDYHGSRPNMDWSTSRPIGFQVTSSRPPAWSSQKPGYPVIASRPTQHWGENSLFGEQSGGSVGSAGYNRPDSYGSSRPHGYDSSRPDGYGSQRPHGYDSSRPDSYGSLGPGTGGGRPDYGSGRPFVGSVHHGSVTVSDYDSQTADFDKYSGYSDNGSGGGGGGGGKPQINNRPSYDNERPFMNGNDVYGSSQQQTGSGYGKGYASNWDYQTNSMRGPSYAGGWNDQPPRDYLQRRPDGDVLQSTSNLRPSESTPLHYNGHSGIGASTDNGFLYKSPMTISSSSTTPMPTTSS